MHPAPDGANPTLYIVLVALHILGTIIAIGFNFSYVAWIQRATNSPQHLEFALRGVKFLDDWVANPCYLLVGASGLGMVLLGKPIASFLWVAIALYVIAMVVAYAVYTPLLGRQIRVLAANGPNSIEYQQLATRSNVIGAMMGVMVVVIVLLKIFEPTFW
jgi:hypothetical protein